MDWRGTNPFAPTRSLPRSPPRSRLGDGDKYSEIEDHSDVDYEEEDSIKSTPKEENQQHESNIEVSANNLSELDDSIYTSDDGIEERTDDFVEFKELRVFEKMEQMTERPSFCSQESAVDRFMNHNLSFDELKSEDEDEVEDEDEKSQQSLTSEGSLVDEDEDETKENDAVEDANSCVKLDGSVDRKKQLSDEDYKALLRDMYSAVKSNSQTEKLEEPDTLCSTVLERLNQQEAVMKDMKHELQLAKELRKALEYKEKELEIERQQFEAYKLEETTKLEKQEKRVLLQRKSIEKVNDETKKLKEQNTQHLAKINTLTKKISRIETDLRRKSSLWDSEKKKLLERVDELEKSNQHLQGSQYEGNRENRIRSETTTASTRLSQKRIHFSVDNCDSKTSSNNSTKVDKPVCPNVRPQPTKSAMKKGSLKMQIAKRDTESSTETSPTCYKPSDTTETLSFYDTAIVGQMQIEHSMPTSKEHDQESERNSRNNPCNKSCVIVNNLGDTETVYTNGCRKYISKSRNFSRVIYENGDIKEKRPDGSILYFYSELGIRQYHYPNGLEMTSYPNGQMERKNPDGTHEILFPNGCVKFYRMDGREEFIFPDNTVYQVDPSNGNAILFLPNGQKEIHSSNWKKRIYPDGTTKTVFSDGTLETEYPNGRIRRKDSCGNLVFDLLSSTATLQGETSDLANQMVQLNT